MRNGRHRLLSSRIDMLWLVSGTVQYKILEGENFGETSSHQKLVDNILENGYNYQKHLNNNYASTYTPR